MNNLGVDKIFWLMESHLPTPIIPIIVWSQISIGLHKSANCFWLPTVRTKKEALKIMLELCYFGILLLKIELSFIVSASPL